MDAGNPSPMKSSTIYLNEMSLVSPLGNRHDEVLRNLLAGSRDGLVEEAGWLDERAVFVGRVCAELPQPGPALPAAWDCRNNRLLLAALDPIRPAVQKAIAHYGPSRVGVVLGTSTSGIADAEAALVQWHRQGSYPADYHYAKQELGTPSRFLALELGVQGPAYTISTACSSSAKALASARRLIRAGICDAVIAGGADTLCQLTLRGFAALESLSAGRCNPFAASRDGINIGEAAALFLVTAQEGPVALLGAGESSDAHHMSAPHPAGRGAIRALEQALADGGVSPAQIDYLNLHGTATPQNDAMESTAVHQVLGAAIPASSTKALTGHTLGAAGALEAALCWLLLSGHNAGAELPVQVMDGEPDPRLAPVHLVRPGESFQRKRENFMLSNSFAFGGNNVSLLLRGTS